MKVGLVQTKPEFGSVERNRRAAFDSIAGRRADLWIFPELAFTGYQFRNKEELESLAEPVEGDTVRALQRFAAQSAGAVVAGFAEKTSGRLYNSAVLVDSSGLLGLYRKVHLFDREKELFSPGDLGFPVFPCHGVIVGLMICFDWIFPEAARSLALAGAQVIAHPANLVLPYCQDAVVTRAIENQVFVGTANRVGVEERRPEERLVFSGRSRLAAPNGEVIIDGPADAPGIFVAEIDPGRANEKKVTDRNHLFDDRRTDQYRTG